MRPSDAFERELLLTWLDAAQVGLVVLNATGTVVMVNARACELTGVQELSAVGSAVGNLFAAVSDAPELVNWLAESTFYGARDAVAMVDGKVRHLQLRCKSIAYRVGQLYKVVSVEDVSDLRAAQTLAAQTQRQWQAMNAGVVISDARRPDMPIVYVNPAFERMSGYAVAEIIGRNCRFLQGKEHDQVEIIQLREALKNKKSVEVTLRNYRKNGELFYNHLVMSPLFDSKGNLLYFLGVQFDVTPQIRAEDEIKELKEQLARFRK